METANMSHEEKMFRDIATQHNTNQHACPRCHTTDIDTFAITQK